MRLFITGATGFIGSRLTSRLLQDGHHVSVLVRPLSDLSVLNGVAGRLDFHVYDGSLKSMTAGLEEARPDVVIHLASNFLAQHMPGDVEALIGSNIDMPAKLLEAMALTGTKRFINTGTSWQHYLSQTYNPVNLYAATKQAFEAILAYYIEARGVRAATLKLFDTYGPGDTRPKLFTLLRKTALSGNVLKMSPGEQLLDLVYIDDVIEAYLKAIDGIDDIAEAYFAVSNPQRFSLREVASLYSQIVGRPLNIEWGGLPYRERETLEPWTSGQPIDGWVPRIGLAEGIRRMELAAGSIDFRAHGQVS